MTARPEPPPAVTIVSCGSNASISKADQARAADELDALPDSSTLANVIVPDWQRMRDENRACAARK